MHTLIKLAIPSHLVGNISSRYIHAGCWHTMQPHTHGAYECCTVTVQLQMWLWVCRVRVCASVCVCGLASPAQRGAVNFDVAVALSIATPTSTPQMASGWGNACRSISLGKWVTIHDRAMRAICIYGRHGRLAPLPGCSFLVRPQNSLVNLLLVSAAPWHGHTHTHIYTGTLCKNAFCHRNKKRKLVQILNANDTQKETGHMAGGLRRSWRSESGSAGEAGTKLTKSSTQIVVATARLKTKLVFFE